MKKLVFITLFLFFSLQLFAQTENKQGNSITSGAAADFSSPYSVTAFPAVPICCGEEDTPVDDPDAAVEKAANDAAALEQEQKALQEKANAAQQELDGDAQQAEGNADEAKPEGEAVAEAAAEAVPEQATSETLPEQTVPEVPKSKPVTNKNYPSSYFGMSLVGFHLFTEFGDIEGVQEKFNELKESLAADAGFTSSTINQKVSDINQFARDLQEGGYIVTDMQANLLTPVTWYSDALSGVVAFEATYRLGLHVGFDAGESPIRAESDFPSCINFIGGNVGSQGDCIQEISRAPDLSNCASGSSDAQTIAANCKIFKIVSDSAALLKGYHGYQLGFGYSRTVSSFDFGGGDWLSGEVFAGVKYKYYNLDTYDLAYTYNDHNEGTDFLDKANDEKLSTTLHDLEPGVKFVTKKYEIGLAVEHLLSPKLKYSNNDVSLKAKPYIVASLFNPFSDTRNLSLNFYQDLAEETTLYGFKNKWRVISLDYSPHHWLIPGLRISKRYNLVRTNYDYTQIGLTLFNFLNANYGFTSKKLDIGSETVPISSFASISIDLNF